MRSFVVLPLVIAASILYVGVSLSMFPSPVRQTVLVSSTSTRQFRERQAQHSSSNSGDDGDLDKGTTVTVEQRATLDATALEADLPRATREISCPTFSGPGYVKERHPSRPITVPVLEAPYKEPTRPQEPSGRGSRLQALPLSDVRLLPGSAFHAGFQTNLRFLKQADTDALLLSWRLRASPGRPWPKGSLRLVGWEHTGSELRGHFLGHYLSAVAYSYAATGDAALADTLADLIDALKECEAKASALSGGAAAGYLSAFPEEFLDRLEAIKPVWAPYYTLHKVIAGLLNVARLGDAPEAPPKVQRLAEGARTLAVGLGDYIERRVQRLIAARSADHHFATLNQECGGINDGLWQLAAITGDARHKAVASLFDKPCLLGPLAGGKDELSGMHGNTALALVIGAAHRFELTGEPPFAAIAARFFDLVDGSRSYVTGGSTHNELWGRPGELGHTLVGGSGGMRFEHVESCTTHNMMRLVEMLLRVSGGGTRYAAWVERALINGVLGTLRGEEPGAYLYFLPLGQYVSKAAPQAWRHAGWSTALGDFWCCQGTGVEAFARLGELIYMQRAPNGGDGQGGGGGGAGGGGGGGDGDGDGDGVPMPELYVTQLVPSSVRWRQAGMRLTMRAVTPGAAHPDTPASMELTVDAVEGGARAGRRAAIVLRVPGWAHAPHATLNGATLAAAAATSSAAAPPLANGTYLRLTRTWRRGDVVRLTLPLHLSLEFLPDRRPRFAKLAAVLHGPAVLACVGCKRMGLPRGTSPAALLARITPVPRGASNQLRSLHRPVARGAPAGTVVVGDDDLLYVGEGALPAPPFRHRRRGATDVAIGATFRELPGAFAKEQNTVSFEPYGQPGCLVAAPPSDGGERAASSHPRAPPSHPLQLRLLCARPGAEPLSTADEKAASWRRHDPLVSTAHGSFQSYESVARPGYFISTHGAANLTTTSGGGGGASSSASAARRTPLILARKPPPPPPPKEGEGPDLRFHPPSSFALESSFEEALGEAEYPQSAFWLAGGAGGEGDLPSALMYPLNEVVDEHYSVYFDFGV